LCNCLSFVWRSFPCSNFPLLLMSMVLLLACLSWAWIFWCISNGGVLGLLYRRTVLLFLTTYKFR
jgi:hypothetical protein